eukprot:256041-Pleurochrysis_carterae.AAC.1
MPARKLVARLPFSSRARLLAFPPTRIEKPANVRKNASIRARKTPARVNWTTHRSEARTRCAHCR